MSSQLDRAMRLAVKAHSGQFRKGGLNYIIHPARMVALAWEAGWPLCDDGMYETLWLHDAVEEEGCTLEEIQAETNKLIAKYVDLLTHHHERGTKDTYIESFGTAPIVVLAAKVIDRIDNVRDLITINNVGYARKYYRKALPIWAAWHTRRDEVHVRPWNRLTLKIGELANV